MNKIKKFAILAGLLGCMSIVSAQAQVNEKPVEGKQYNEYLYYDGNEGNKNFSLQGSEKGEQHQYYFNEGATLDSSNDTLHSAILAHNWGDFDTSTEENFHIGEGKEFIIKSYRGYGVLEAEEGAKLSITGGRVVLESGIASTSGMDNTNSAIHMESSGVLDINSDSLWIGNKREDRQNTGAISMSGDNNRVDISVKENFTAEQVDMGLALQSSSENSYAYAGVHAGNNITITAKRSDGGEASGYRGSGIYSLAYKTPTSSNTVSLISDNGNIAINAQGYALYNYGNTKAVLNALNGAIFLQSTEKHGIYANGYFDENSNEITLSAKDINVSGANYGMYLNNTVINSDSGTLKVAGSEYGVYGTDTRINVSAGRLEVGADSGWSVCLFTGSEADFKADRAHFYNDIYSKSSVMNVSADENIIDGQVRVLEGGNITFDAKENNGIGSTSVITTEKDAVTAISDAYDINDMPLLTEIYFKQAAYINSQGDEVYHADKQGEYTDSAIRAMRNSVVTLDKAAGIYGDIIAGKGAIDEDNSMKSWQGGHIMVTSADGAVFKGDVLAGNTGTIDLILNNASCEGRMDDYADATLKYNVFRPGEFDVDITEGGTVNLTLNNSIWTAFGENFVTNLDFGENGGLVDLSQDQNNSVTIRNLSGDGTFNMLLNAKNHAMSDMLYIGKNTGSQTVCIVGGITGGLESISAENPLRFATVGIDSDGLPDAQNAGQGSIRAYTRDAGALDLEYFVDKEAFDKDDAENEVYNGTGADKTVDKPGNDFVENALVGDRDTAVNWIITGVKEAKKSDAGQTIIDMSKVNYSNAVYMDRLNKRLGEARYLEGNDGLWVRIRHDRIGKSGAFRSQNTMMELGYDQKMGNHHRGLAIDYMRGIADYRNVLGDGDVHRGGLWFYDTWIGDKGHYTDYVLKFGRLSNDFEIYARSTGEKIAGDYNNSVYSASAEYGRKRALGDDWYVEPQVQMQYAHVTGADYTTSQGTQVELDGIDSLIGRIGFRIGQDVDQENQFYVKADILHEFLGDQSICAQDNTGMFFTTYENKGTWYDVGIGFAHRMNKDDSLFLDVEKSFGNDNDDTWQINVGINWKI